MPIKFTNKDENFFKKNGYLIKKTNNYKSLNYLKEFICKNLIDLKKKINNKPLKNRQSLLENFHKNFNKNQLNPTRLKIIEKINKDKNFDKEYYSASKEILDFLVGNEIAMQTKINLSIQIPNDKTSMLPMHSDIYAGESPFEVVC